MPSVVVIGAYGKMGRISCQTLKANPEFKLLAELGRGDSLSAALQQHQPDIVLDFTRPECVFEHALQAIEHQVRPVIGTSGLTLEQIEQLTARCLQQQLGAMVVPNFSIGAILMMRFAAQAAQYLPAVEIVELHHGEKVDAPSGTARKTAECLSESVTLAPIDSPNALSYKGVPIHSVRLPGLFAHQAVRCHAKAETLTIKHDAHSRESMMPGVVLSLQRVMQLSSLEYGLASALFV